MKKYLLFFTITILLHVSSNLHAQPFTDSNLPIAVINTYGQYIDTAYQTFTVGLGVIDNGPGARNHLTDPFNNFNNKAEIQLHGSSTLYLPKKSYSITTLNSALQKTDVNLMDLPPEHDWVFKALYQDKTLIRDDIAFRIYNQMGHYSSRSVFFELVIDGDYKGVYELEEKIKKDSYRVDIAKLKASDIAGDDLTGGYIVKLDKYLPGEQGWYSNYNSNISADSANYYLYDYPNPDSMPLVQKNYIKNYFNKFEDVFQSSYFNDPDSGYSKYLNVSSFVDNLIVNEISKNVDGYRSSTYFYKDKDSRGDGKLHSAPVWDFNIAWDNCSYNGGNNPSGWQYQVFATGYFVPFWWWKLMSDNSFKDQLKCRYEYLRNSVLSLPLLDHYVDSMATYLNESQLRNFNRWPIMGTAVYPNPAPVPADYAGEISNIKNWLSQRLSWMDGHTPGVCVSGIQENVSENLIHSFPNPFTNDLTITYDITENSAVKIELLNVVGENVMEFFNGNKSQGNYKEEFNTSSLAPGIYIVRLKMKNQNFYQKVIKL